MRIRKRIFTPMIALTAGCCIIVLAASILIYSLEIKTVTNDKINVASMVVEHEIGNLKRNAHNTAIAMAHNPNLIEALTANNREEIIRTANALQTLTQVDSCTILDKEGLVLARTHEPGIYGDSLAHLPHVMQALDGNIETYIIRGVTIRLGIYAGAPIYDSAMNMVGIVSLGYKLDAQEFIDELKTITGCEISVFLDGERVSSTIFNEDEIYMPEPNVNARRLGGRGAVENFLPLKGLNDEVMGMIGVTYYTMDEANKILFFIVSGALITLAVLGTGIVLSGFMYRFVERQLKNMMNEIREAEETARRAIEEKDMLTNLGNIMNGLDVMIYATDPKTSEILFINDCMKQHYGIEGDCTGQLCYKVLQKNPDGKCDFCPCFQLDEEPDKVVVWEEHSTLTNRVYRNADRYIDWPNGQKVHLQHSVDATELVAAKESAERTSRYKTAFLANMSHEIRTPMNAILGIAEIQLLDKNLSPNAKDAFNKVYESGDLLLNIINDILDLSKIEAGKLELLPVKYDIPSLLHDTAQINLLRHESRPISFSLQVDKDTPHDFYGDELRIKQILNNILSNAFKYTGEGAVELSVSAESDRDDGGEDVTLILRVSDTGQGMTEEQVSSLFDEYTRFNIEANRTTIGTGLGMSITKSLIDLMNGDISVESEPNKGSVFTVRLPQKRIGSALCGTDLADRLRNFNSAALTKKLRFFREYMPYGSVLVVDDVESNLYVTEGMLRPYGLKVETASSGFEAVEKIKSGKTYDIVFMDHMMPKMDGIEATKIIRAMGYTHSIVALTANALLGRAEMFLQNGFDGYISKPIDSREMNFLLNDLIRNRKTPEVVEAARLEQPGKEPVNTDTSGQKQAKVRASEIEKFFVLDAKEAIKTLEDLCRKIHALDNAEIEKYIATVNGIKNALSNIGEKEMSGMALELEKAGKERNFSLMASETSAFINSLESLITKLEAK